jgi:hypothetical protein
MIGVIADLKITTIIMVQSKSISISKGTTTMSNEVVGVMVAIATIKVAAVLAVNLRKSLTADSMEIIE